MSNNETIIPIFSEGKQIGGLSVAMDGSVSSTYLNDVGTQQCAAVTNNKLEYIFDLVPTHHKYAEAPPTVSAQLARDEMIRKEAMQLLAMITEHSRLPFSPSAAVSLAAHIERFIKEGRA